MSVVAIASSPSRNSRSARLADHAVSRLQGLNAQTLHLRDLSPVALLSADFEAEGVHQSLKLVQESAALIIATPIYKASYSGLLKVFLDLLPQDGLAGKVILPVATSGSLAHVLALDYTLRPVLASLGASVVLESVVIPDQQIAIGSAGEISVEPAAAARLDRAIVHLREALGWLGSSRSAIGVSARVQGESPAFAI
jgi:FMN reductase